MTRKEMGRATVVLTVVLAAVLAGGILLQIRGASPPPVALHVTVPADIPVRIERLNIKDNPPQVNFGLVNSGQERLVALEITWTFKFSDGHAVRSEDRKDFIFGHEKLAPGAEENMDMGLPTSTKSGVRLSSIHGLVTFTEFADQRRSGSDQQRMVPWLKGQRAAQLAAYQQLLHAYQVGGASALQQELETENPSESAVKGAIRRTLLRMQSKEGTDGVVNRLNDVGSLKLPE
jgi:hypothetical protein